MTRIWLTSDPHFGHRYVASLRGFADVDDHDNTLVNNFLVEVKPEDQVWWLGDLAMSNPDRALECIQRIPGTHHLIWGNHDLGSPIHRDSHKQFRRYLSVFATAQAYARRKISGEMVLLSHYPYADTEGDHTEENRYTQYRLPNEGLWLIHGHTHLKYQRVHGRQIHVGLDAWDLFPVPLTFIEKVIAEA